ncbi:MAG TPA: hypothetical protein VKY74_18055, partial [Chloroflexia bacterium]|nr:hypothetical protein [Chloroflexia bacterium]
RFCTGLALCLAVLAAHGLAAIQGRIRAPAARAAPAVLAVVLTGIEFFAVPRPLIAPDVQPFFQQLAAHPSPCNGLVQEPLSRCDAVLELPQITWIPPGMFHQAIDHHPMISGYTSRHYAYPFVDETPGVAQLVNADPTSLGGDIVTPAPGEIALRAMDYYGVRYVVVHPLADYHPAPALQRTLQRLFPGPGVRSGDLTVYTVPPVPQDRAFLFLGENWYAPEHDAAGAPRRWTDARATLRIVVPRGTEGRYTLALTVYAVASPRTLVVTLDDQELARQAVALPPGRPVRVPLMLSAGEHLVGLASLEPAIQPRGDRRRLSLGYDAIALARAP